MALIAEIACALVMRPASFLLLMLPRLPHGTVAVPGRCFSSAAASLSPGLVWRGPERHKGAALLRCRYGLTVRRSSPAPASCEP